MLCSLLKSKSVVVFYLYCIFSYLVIAVSLQISWSLSLVIVDAYALLVRRSLRKRAIVRLFAIGDGVKFSSFNPKE